MIVVPYRAETNHMTLLNIIGRHHVGEWEMQAVQKCRQTLLARKHTLGQTKPNVKLVFDLKPSIFL